MTESIRNTDTFTVRAPWPDELERAHLSAAARSIAAEERHLRVLVVGDPERLVGAAVLHLAPDAQPARLTFDLRPRFIGDPIGAAFLVEVLFLAACRNVSAVVIDLPRESPLPTLFEAHGFVHESPATTATGRLRRTFPHTPSTA